MQLKVTALTFGGTSGGVSPNLGAISPLEMKEDKGKLAFIVSISVIFGCVKFNAVLNYTGSTSGNPSHFSWYCPSETNRCEPFRPFEHQYLFPTDFFILK